MRRYLAKMQRRFMFLMSFTNNDRPVVLFRTEPINSNILILRLDFERNKIYIHAREFCLQKLGGFFIIALSEDLSEICQ